MPPGIPVGNSYKSYLLGLSNPQGAWWSPDSHGVNRRDNINTITKYHPTPLDKGNSLLIK